MPTRIGSAIAATRSNCGYGDLRGCETDRMKPDDRRGEPVVDVYVQRLVSVTESFAYGGQAPRRGKQQPITEHYIEKTLRRRP